MNILTIFVITFIIYHLFIYLSIISLKNGEKYFFINFNYLSI